MVKMSKKLFILAFRVINVALTYHVLRIVYLAKMKRSLMKSCQALLAAEDSAGQDSVVDSWIQNIPKMMVLVSRQGVCPCVSVALALYEN